MTKVAIFTPTQRPGIDVTAFSIARQEADAEILWIVCDELFAERAQLFQQVVKPIVNCETHHFYLPKADGNQRNLAQAYNIAIEKARSWDADLFVSLQDYIYVPPDGLQKFIDMYQKVDVGNKFPAIYTGICSITEDPADEKVHDLNGLFTIFDEPYNKRPQVIEWMDVRYRVNEKADFHYCIEIEYETNWAALPKSALYDERLYFDVSYDEGVAYENQDYAYRAVSNGYQLLLDMKNQVLSLPHKRFFSEEWAHEQPLTDVNRQRTEDTWGKM
jgi:hypothetical protein